MFAQQSPSALSATPKDTPSHLRGRGWIVPMLIQCLALLGIIMLRV